MAQPYRVRVELPDRPGALAKVASIIAGLGGNVVSVDIHEVEGEQAVDEIAVDVPDDWGPANLAAALEEAGAGVLLSSHPGHDTADPIVRSLRWAAAMLEAGPQHCDLELTRALLETCPFATAWLCRVEEALGLPAGQLALERGGPVVRLSEALPEQLASDLPSSVWLLAVPDGHLNPQRVAFLARPTSLRFTASEVARAEALLALRRQLAPELERSRW